MKNPSRAVAQQLAEILGPCTHCSSALSGHEYALLASCVIAKEKGGALVGFFEAIKNHHWPKVNEFQIWLGGADDVEAYVVRCAGRNLTVVVIKTHFELFQGAQLLYSEALPTEECNKLSDAFTNVQWHPF